MRHTPRTLILLLALTMVAVPLLVVGPSASAVPAKKKRSTAVTAVCPTGAVTPGSFKRARYIWKRLRVAGYSPAATAGVLGNLDHVSGLTPTAVSDDKTRFGIAQWPRKRWNRYVERVNAAGGNRWSLASQTTYLLHEMAGGFSVFNDTTFRTRINPAKAAAVFSATFMPPSPTVMGIRGTKARLWASYLADTPAERANDIGTYGSKIPCNPPGARLDRCPPVGSHYKAFFRDFTGFNWNDMSANARKMSRCVYTNFPPIKMQGTYNGHMPDWSQAIDFMMPSGCVTGSKGSYTRSPAEQRMGSRLARYLFENADRLGIDYLIWQDHIRNPGEHADENTWTTVGYWRPDNYNNGDCTNTHFDHVHASVYSSMVNAWVRPMRGNPEGHGHRPEPLPLIP
ncbi:MAG: phage tail tip lysozyme [Candidatus Nanopelagicales bacterium]